MTNRIANKLSHWGIKPIEIQPLTVRENKVFKIISHNGNFALKLARTEHRSTAQINSEMQLLQYLDANNFAAIKPVSTLDGKFVVSDEEGLLSLTHWLEEATPFEQVWNEQLFFDLGKSMYTFHQLTTQWQLPATFERPLWNREGLLGETPVWGQFWMNPILSKQQQNHLLAFRDYAYQHFPQEKQQVIHADLVKENILITNNQLCFIDFDDTGIGNKYFDIATALLKNDNEPLYKQWRSALIHGYSENETINIELLELFLAIRSVTYLGWIMKHPLLDNAGQKSKSHLIKALNYTTQFV